MWSRRRVGQSVLFALLVGPCWAMTNEELVVRATYAKIEFGTRLNKLLDEIKGIKSKVMVNDDIHIRVTDVVVGDISEVNQRLWGDVVTKPSGRVLSGGQGWDEVAPQMTRFYSIQIGDWYTHAYLAEDWKVPVSRMLAMNGQSQTYTRYGAFKVHVWYRDETRRYSAMFLFRDAQSSTPDGVNCLDNILGSVVQGAVGLPLADDSEKLRTYDNIRAVREFRKSLQPESDCALEPRSLLCCSPSTGICGIRLPEAQSRIMRPPARGPLVTPAVLLGVAD
jgi:hypothetical protein